MISKIIQDIIDPLFVGIEWLEHYGGYTIPVDLESTNTEKRLITQTFPFSPDYAVEECTKDSQYLVPNKNKLSIAYWEVLADMEIVDSEMIPGDSAAHFTQAMRLVVWFNFGKMGYTTPTMVKHSIFSELMQLLDGYKVKNTADPLIKLIRLDVSASSKSQSRGLDIFSQYSYLPTYRQLFKYPYDFFAIDFDFEWMIWKKCIPAVSLQDSVVC